MSEHGCPCSSNKAVNFALIDTHWAVGAHLSNTVA